MLDNDKKKVVYTSYKKAPSDRGIGDTQAFSNLLCNKVLSRSPYINKMREHALDVYQKTPFPNKQEEAWRRTDISRISKIDFHMQPIQKNGQSQFAITYFDGSHKKLSGKAVVNSKGINIELSQNLKKDGVIFSTLEDFLTIQPELSSRIFDEVVKPEDGKFAALTAALCQQNLVLFIPKGKIIPQPFVCEINDSEKNSIGFSRVSIFIESGAQANVILDYSSRSLGSDAMAVHSSILEVIVGENSKLNLIETQQWGNHVWMIGHERALVENKGELNWFSGSVGGKLVKLFSDVDLKEINARAKITGFYFADTKQHFDLDTQQNHLAPETTSDLLYKGALYGDSKTVWQGMIYVAPNAIKTDGYQNNRNLMLSNSAKANSIPGLEILADDVKCSHGATISKIDPTEKFYLQSRGISASDTEELLVKGFFSNIFERITEPTIRKYFEKIIAEKLEQQKSK